MHSRVLRYVLMEEEKEEGGGGGLSLRAFGVVVKFLTFQVGFKHARFGKVKRFDIHKRLTVHVMGKRDTSYLGGECIR